MPTSIQYYSIPAAREELRLALAYRLVWTLAPALGLHAAGRRALRRLIREHALAAVQLGRAAGVEGRAGAGQGSAG